MLAFETNQAIKHVKHRLWKLENTKNDAIQKHTCESRRKINKIKLGFLGQFMCMHELPCVRIIKHVCEGLCLENTKNTTKLKTLNLRP